ncbi:uncharacterized protein LOC128954211 [Oppia nitens]|uniref:uncharacterized protein LOC128954211 n=1 Tax=Oppia nitens TaxID=1686743 RepID=UPI0023DB6656|nr:uncharacterized protein LOC128954211 [Oppia nitens]
MAFHLTGVEYPIFNRFINGQVVTEWVHSKRYTVYYGAQFCGRGTDIDSYDDRYFDCQNDWMYYRKHTLQPNIPAGQQLMDELKKLMREEFIAANLPVVQPSEKQAVFEGNWALLSPDDDEVASVYYTYKRHEYFAYNY